MSAAAATSKQAKPTKKYRLNDGYHVGPDPVNPAVDRTYERGDIIESPTDLTFMNVPGYKPKFEKVIDENSPALPSGAAIFDPAKETIQQFAERMGGGSFTAGVPTQPSSSSPTTVELDGMNADQLRKYAEAEEIDIKGAKTKEQLLAVVKGSKR